MLSSAQASAALPIQFPASLDLVQGAQSNLTVSASATSGNLVSLRVDELTPSGGTPIAKAEFWNLQFTPARLSEVPFTNPPAYSTSFDTLSYSNSQAPFWPGAQAIQTAARFTGTLFVQTDGAYTFYANSQDGSSISIDGQPVANNDGIHNPSETSGSVVLTNGPHAFQALYFQGLDDAILQVSWSGPGLAKRLIEKSDFSQFSPLQFAETGGPVVSSASGVSNITATLQVRDSFTNAAQIMLTAQDAGGFTAAKLVGVVILPISGLAPIITGPPTNQIVQCTSNATFSVAAVGAPLSYQWYWFGTNQVPGGTNATLTLSDVSLDSSGSYSVVVTNSFGSALSPAANLNVVDTLPPVITLNGANPMQVVQNTSFADPGATAYDACAGSVPVVVFNGVDPSVVGGYTVLYEATDPSGNSATNARTVLVVPPAVACYPTPGGIAAWWKAESNTVDVVGADNGTLVNGAGYAPGIVGTAFSFTSAGQAVQIPFTPAINLSALYDWTIETWVNPAGFKNAGYPTIYSQGYWVASWDSITPAEHSRAGLTMPINWSAPSPCQWANGVMSPWSMTEPTAPSTSMALLPGPAVRRLSIRTAVIPRLAAFGRPAVVPVSTARSMRSRSMAAPSPPLKSPAFMPRVRSGNARLPAPTWMSRRLLLFSLLTSWPSKEAMRSSPSPAVWLRA